MSEDWVFFHTSTWTVQPDQQQLGQQLAQMRLAEVQHELKLVVYIRHRQSCTQCGFKMTSHNATCNAHEVMWKWIAWQRRRRTCYRVQYHNVAWYSIYECLFELSSTTNILHCLLVHNKNTSPPTILEMYVSLVCFDRDMFPSKYARRVQYAQ